MMKPTKIYKPFSVVVVPFPFTDIDKAKRRPALVLSSMQHQEETGHVTLLMITSAKNSAWKNDCPIHDLASAGVDTPSVVRQKTFTLDSRLVLAQVGMVTVTDRKKVLQAVKKHLVLTTR
jgi:mRNA interferase MazF